MSGIKGTLVGRLTRDAGNMRYTSGGVTMIGFDVVVQGVKAPDGGTQRAWIVVFGSLAKQLDGALKKYDHVRCEGEIRLDIWRTPDGDGRPGLCLNASSIQPIAKIGRRVPPRERRRRRQNGQTTQQEHPAPETVAVGADRNLRRELALDDHADDTVPF